MGGIDLAHYESNRVEEIAAGASPQNKIAVND